MCPGVTLLIVEDDPDVREVVAEVLGDEGYAVACVNDGLDALAWLRDHSNPRPRLILLDLRMPRMDGRQFREEQLGDPALRDIPVVILSADGRLPEIAESLAVSAYLQKPIHLEPLLQAVRRYA